MRFGIENLGHEEDKNKNPGLYLDEGELMYENVQTKIQTKIGPAPDNISSIFEDMEADGHFDAA